MREGTRRVTPPPQRRTAPANRTHRWRTRPTFLLSTLAGPDCRLYENDADLLSAVNDVRDRLHEIEQILYDAGFGGFPPFLQSLFIPTTCP